LSAIDWSKSASLGIEFSTETSGQIFMYPGPTTRGRPIYDERFNMKERKPLPEERTDL
jgi:hypothetical protein